MATGESRLLDVPSQADPLHQRDQIPSEVELPPLESVTGRIWEGVMVVMPAVPEGEDA
jgi:hypothetical protein